MPRRRLLVALTVAALIGAPARTNAEDVHRIPPTAVRDRAHAELGALGSTRAGASPIAAATADGNGGAIIAWSDRRNGVDGDIYAQRVSDPSVGRPVVQQWQDNGVPICAVPGEQDTVMVVSDGAGGAILAWQDARTGTPRTFAQRVNAAGASQWPPNGIELGGPDGWERFPALCSDQQGGAIVVWRGVQLRAQRVNSTGNLLWGSDAVAIASDLDIEWSWIVSDDSGGAIVGWRRHSLDSHLIRLNRIDANGNLRWGEAGVEIASAEFPEVAMTSDGAGGAFVSWRNASFATLAQHVAADGAMLWPGGAPVLPSAGGFGLYRASILSDGAAGTIVAAAGRVQRLDAAGQPMWGDGGVSLLHDPNETGFTAAIPDGAGGAIVACGAHVQRVNAAGAPQWPDSGIAMSIWPRDPGNDLVPTPSGGAIVVWKDFRTFDGVPQVYAQELGADGSALWEQAGDEVFVTAGKRRAPVCVADGSGHATFVWQEKRGGYWTIVARKFDSANQPLWPPIVCAEAKGSQLSPLAISGRDGGVLVVWVDHRAREPQLFAQRLDADGGRLWGDGGQLVGGDTPTVTLVGIVPDGTGGIVVGWSIQKPFDDVLGVRLQRISGDGTRRWASQGIGVPVGFPYGARGVSLASDATGGAMLAWEEVSPGAFLFAQRVDGNGAVRWAVPGGAPLCLASSSKYPPVVVPDDSGGVIAAWSDSRSGAFAQSLDSNGVARWTTDGVPLVNGANFPGSMSLRIIRDGAGGAVVSWTDGRLLENNFGQNGIYLQRVAHSGAILWAAAGVPARATFEYVENAVLAPDGNGGAIASWQEIPPGGTWASDLYARRVSSDGSVAWAAPSSVCLFPRGTRVLTGADTDATGGAYFAWVDQRDSTLDDVYSLRLTGNGFVAPGWDTNGVTAVLAALISNEVKNGEVTLVWWLSGPVPEVRIERSLDGQGWHEIGRASPDGSRHVKFTDRDLYPGQRVGYRIALGTGGGSEFTGVTWLDIPSIELRLTGCRPNPSPASPLRVAFSLASNAPATMELFDVNGRRLASMEISGLEPGPQEVLWDVGGRRAPGVYLLRLRQQTRSVVTRVLVTR